MAGEVCAEPAPDLFRGEGGTALQPCSMGVKGERESSTLSGGPGGQERPTVMGFRGAGTLSLIEDQGADEIAALSGSGGEAPRSEVQKAKRVWSGPAEGWSGVEGQ
jgi:hypothetical protein